MMNHGEVHQISMKIGELSNAVEMMTDLWRRQEQAATVGRKALHDKVEALRSEVGAQIGGLSHQVDRLVETMKVVEPAVKSFQDEKLRREGATRLGKALIAGMTVAAGAVGAGVTQFFNYLKH